MINHLATEESLFVKLSCGTNVAFVKRLLRSMLRIKWIPYKCDRSKMDEASDSCYETNMKICQQWFQLNYHIFTWAATSQAISVLDASCPFTNTLILEHCTVSWFEFMFAIFVLLSRSYLYFRLGPTIVDVHNGKHIPEGGKISGSFTSTNQRKDMRWILHTIIYGTNQIKALRKVLISLTTCEAGTHIWHNVGSLSLSPGHESMVQQKWRWSW